MLAVHDERNFKTSAGKIPNPVPEQNATSSQKTCMTDREPCSCQLFMPLGVCLLFLNTLSLLCLLYKQNIRVLAELSIILDINRITLTSVVVITIIICILFTFCRNRRGASWKKRVLLVSACAPARWADTGWDLFQSNRGESVENQAEAERGLQHSPPLPSFITHAQISAISCAKGKQIQENYVEMEDQGGVENEGLGEWRFCEGNHWLGLLDRIILHYWRFTALIFIFICDSSFLNHGLFWHESHAV